MEDVTKNPAEMKPEVKAERSRVGVIWLSIIAFVIVLLLLLIFILQNSETVHIKFLGAKGSIGFGVALLLSAVIGAILTILVGSIRIIQLKLAARHHEVK